MQVVRPGSRGREVWLSLAVALLAGVFGAAPAEALDLSEELGETWYGVYLQDRKCGHAVFRASEETYQDAPAYAFAMDVTMKIVMLGKKIEMAISEKRLFEKGEQGRLLYVRHHSRSPLELEIEGRVAGARMKLTTKQFGRERTTEIEAPRETLADFLVEKRLAERNAKIGDRIESVMFEPSLMKCLASVTTLKARREILWDGVPVSVLETETLLKDLGAMARSYLTERGEMLQTQIAKVLVLRRESQAAAQDISYSRDVVTGGVVRTKKIIRKAPKVTRLAVRLKGLPGEALIIPSARQRYEKEADGAYVLRIGMDQLPTGGSPKRPFPKKDFSAELAATHLVQSDDELVIRTAKAVIGDETDAWRATKKIVAWVDRTIRVKPVPILSNALAVLETKEGDCTEHAVLFVALARAVGIPARQACGLVYWEPGGGFYYHAWAEAYVGRWIAVDPISGQYAVDATHIKLAHGEMADFVKAIGTFGQLQAEVLEYGYD